LGRRISCKPSFGILQSIGNLLTHSFACCSGFLGGAKKGSLPLTQQAILLKSTLTEVPQLCLQSWKSITSLCAFWILFRVDASATSMASLGSELTEITGHLEEAFKNSFSAAW